MKRLLWLVTALAFAACPALAQDDATEANEEESPLGVFLVLGFENPAGDDRHYNGYDTGSGDLLLRAGIGLEYAGVGGNPDTYLIAEYLKIAWGNSEVADQDRWHYALKQYFGSFRNEGVFYEALINRILDDLVGVLDPRRLEVRGEFSVRGGLSSVVVARHPDVAGGQGSDE